MQKSGCPFSMDVAISWDFLQCEIVDSLKVVSKIFKELVSSLKALFVKNEPFDC